MKSTLLILSALALTMTGALSAEDVSLVSPQEVVRDPALLTVDRIFGSQGLSDSKLGEIQWSKRTSDFFTLEDSASPGKGRDLVRIDPATGRKETVIPAIAFVPKGKTEPLKIDGFEFSADESRLLLYTESKRVWRRNTRGDYWVLDVGIPGSLRKLGGNAAPSTLMFAKFSPDGTRVAYVRENNLYVQDLRQMNITALTEDGSPTLINGTSDWVNEEELDIRDGFRRSPDGQAILFWQFDTAGVREFHLINNTDGNYPRIISFPYPKVGETNSATRLGVISASGGEVRWLEVPGDAREHYLARAKWTPDGKQILVQQFNRLQNTNRVMSADPETGLTRVLMTETDAAWLEDENPIPMERTSVTELRNVNGALSMASMARLGPDTAQASFSIVIGDQPEIHQSQTGIDGNYKTETLDPPIKILRAHRK